MAARVLWTQAMLSRIEQGYAARERVVDIAQGLGVSAPTVVRVAKSLGCQRRTRSKHKGDDGEPTEADRSKIPMRYPGEPAPRRCLSCAESFDSEGPGHRICNDCREAAAWTSGVHRLEPLYI